MPVKYGPWGIVAGGSDGTGIAFGHEMAARGISAAGGLLWRWLGEQAACDQERGCLAAGHGLRAGPSAAVDPAGVFTASWLTGTGSR